MQLPMAITSRKMNFKAHTNIGTDRKYHLEPFCDMAGVRATNID
jgi:hypothetical protein